jgi:ribonucleoside-diphosphate reductase alpha chain
VDQVYERLVTEEGLRGAARYYGASFASYSCHQLAGRLGYADLMNRISPVDSSSILLYVERVRGILRPEIIAYMLNNASHFQSYVNEVDQRFGRSFDWLMLMSHETSYLLRDAFEGKVVETPALMHFRVIAELFYPVGDDAPDELAEAILCYELATKPYFTFASPVFFNSGHKVPNLCSCFLMAAEDSLTGIMGAMYKAALVSKATGGVGMNVSSLRHSRIGHNGMSRGIIPMLQVYDKLIRYVDQTGKRNGASTVFLQAHHIDLLPFLRATLKNADSDGRFDSLNTAVMFPDLFWERLRENGPWTLFCPAIFPGLNETFGTTYRELYLKYESMPLTPRDEEFRIRTTALEVANTLANSQIMSGMPYVLHKDSINYCSNQVNMSSPNPLHHRVIQASNLCLEIMEQVDSEEVACCNLGQMSLKAFVIERRGKQSFDFEKFGFAVRSMVRFLDRVIDRNKYVFQEAKTSNLRHRPIGLGVSGYADMLDIMGIAYESDEASELNRKVFACMYYNAMVSSMELAIKNGPYSTFRGSPLSEGKFSFDLWKVRKAMLEPDVVEPEPVQPSEWGQQPLFIEGLSQILSPSWDSLRALVVQHGVRNSQMIAIMPSASTSRLMGNAENTEAHQANLYLRNFMRASAVIINPQLFAELDGKLGVWSRDIAEFIIAEAGSIARIGDFLVATADTDEEKARITELLPDIASVCHRYKTMFELKQLQIVRQVADRHRYICQGVSFNVYLDKPSRTMLRNLHMATHRSGLKTGLYYLRETAPNEAPEYARTSLRVKMFLTGPVMPPIASHEPFPRNPETGLTTTQVAQIFEHRWDEKTVPRVKSSPVPPKADTIHEEDGHSAFTLLMREEVEVVAEAVAQGRALAAEEEGPVCRRQPGCVGCGS